MDEAGTLPNAGPQKRPVLSTETSLHVRITWKDMAVHNLKTGEPRMTLTGWAKKRLDNWFPIHLGAVMHVTLTDDHP